MKEYLLDKYNHTCQYCGVASNNKVLEWEHKIPKSRGGSDSIKNATLACHTCNQDKGDKTPGEYLEALKERYAKTKKGIDAIRIRDTEKVCENKKVGGSDRYCAWVNTSRKYIQKALYDKFGNVECSSGGTTKFNRTELELPKDHHYDALCVGTVPKGGYKDLTNGYVLYIKAMGRGQDFVESSIHAVL